MSNPTFCFGGLKKKWRGMIQSLPCLGHQEQKQQCEASSHPVPGVPGCSNHENGGETRNQTLAHQQAPFHPATTWLLRGSTQGKNDVPIVSQAALNDRLKTSEKVVVMCISSAPPGNQALARKRESGSSLQSWCSALHLSGSLQPLLNAHCPSDYMDFIQALVDSSSPGLHEALMQCGQRAWQSQSGSRSGLATIFQLGANPLTVTLPIQGLHFGLTLVLTPMLIKASKPAYQPAVFIEHLVEHHEATLEQQLRYKDMLLSRAPAILTICDLQGNVLHQNAASIQYAGNRTPLLVPTSRTARPAYNYLLHALRLEPDCLNELLEEIDMGHEWSATCVRVPATLQPPTPPITPATTHTHPVPYLTPPPGPPSSMRPLVGNGDLPVKAKAVAGCSAKASGPVLAGAKSWDHKVLRDITAASQTCPLSATPPASPKPCRNRAASLENLSARSMLAAPSMMSEHEPTEPPPRSSAAPSGSQGHSSSRSHTKPTRLNLLLKSFNGSREKLHTDTQASFTHLDHRAHSVTLTASSSARLDVAGVGGGLTRWQELQTYDGIWSCLDENLEVGAVRSHSDLKGGYTIPAASLNLRDIKSAPSLTSTHSEAGLVASQALPAEGSSPGEPPAGLEPPTSWHEIKAWPTIDPTTGATLVVISQVDVTERMESDARTSQVSEACVSLLELIFPRHVIEHLAINSPLQITVGRDPANPAAGSQGGTATLDQLATKHECVTLFFCDIVGFTTMSKEVEPVQVMQFLNSLYSAYDQLVDEFGVYKVETVGDCYVVAGGLMTQDEEGFACVDREGRNDGTSHALAVYRFAQAVLRVAASTPMPHNGQPVQIRIGLHSGPITSGIIGHRMPKFCLFGDSMNTCSRMETTAPLGSIHLSQATYELLAEQQSTEGLVCTGGVDVKGKGRMVTYVYTPPSPGSPPPPTKHAPQFPLLLEDQPLSAAGDALTALTSERARFHLGPGQVQARLLSGQETLIERDEYRVQGTGNKPRTGPRTSKTRENFRQVLDLADINSAPLQKLGTPPHKLWRPTARDAVGLSANLQVLCSKQALRPSTRVLQEDSPLRSTTRVQNGDSALGVCSREESVLMGMKVKGMRAANPQDQASGPLPFRSASPTCHLLKIVSTLSHQQQVAHRQAQVSDPALNSECFLLSSVVGPRSQIRTTRGLGSAALASVLSNLQLGDQRRSSSSILCSAQQRAVDGSPTAGGGGGGGGCGPDVGRAVRRLSFSG